MSLTLLPTELLARIAILLHAKDAVCLASSCHHVRAQMDHPIIWRSIVTSSPAFDNNAVDNFEIYARDSHLWKIWAHALACASRLEEKLEPSLPRVFFWLPQLMLFRHKYIDRSLQISAFHESGQGLAFQQDIQQATEQLNDRLKFFVPIRNLGADTPNIAAWRSAYASAFCVACYVFASGNRRSGPGGQAESFGFSFSEDGPALREVPWIRIDKSDPDLSPVQLQNLIVILQTLAIRAATYFAVELRSTKNNPSQNVQQRLGHLPGVPLLERMPLASILDIPDPFADSGLTLLPTCHLSKMTDPKFFENGTWIGCFHFGGVGGLPTPGGGASYEYIGADCLLQRRLPSTTAAPTFRFYFVRWETNTRFSISSTWTHTGQRIFKFDILVDQETGQLEIIRTDIELDNTESRGGSLHYGVMTPFGIMALFGTGYFFWLWKTAWGEPGVRQAQ